MTTSTEATVAPRRPTMSTVDEAPSGSTSGMLRSSSSPAHSQALAAGLERPQPRRRQLAVEAGLGAVDHLELGRGVAGELVEVEHQIVPAGGQVDVDGAIGGGVAEDVADHVVADVEAVTVVGHHPQLVAAGHGHVELPRPARRPVVAVADADVARGAGAEVGVDEGVGGEGALGLPDHHRVVPGRQHGAAQGVDAGAQPRRSQRLARPAATTGAGEELDVQLGAGDAFGHRQADRVPAGGAHGDGAGRDALGRRHHAGEVAAGVGDLDEAGVVGVDQERGGARLEPDLALGPVGPGVTGVEADAGGITLDRPGQEAGAGGVTGDDLGPGRLERVGEALAVGGVREQAAGVIGRRRQRAPRLDHQRLVHGAGEGEVGGGVVAQRDGAVAAVVDDRGIGVAGIAAGMEPTARGGGDEHGGNAERHGPLFTRRRHADNGECTSASRHVALVSALTAATPTGAATARQPRHRGRTSCQRRGMANVRVRLLSLAMVVAACGGTPAPAVTAPPAPPPAEAPVASPMPPPERVAFDAVGPLPGDWRLVDPKAATAAVVEGDDADGAAGDLAGRRAGPRRTPARRGALPRPAA